jgi:hypothetical protein
MYRGNVGSGGGNSSAIRGRPALIPSRDCGSLYGRGAERTYQTRLFCRHQMAVMVTFRVKSSVVACAPQTAEMRNYCSTFWRSSYKSDTKCFSVIKS